MTTGAGVDVQWTGTVYLDMVFTGLAGRPEPGREFKTREMGVSPGGIANIAIALARLGLAVRLDAAFGRDVYGDYLWRTLDAEGVDLSGSRRYPDWTTPVTVSLVYQADRGMVTYERPSPERLLGFLEPGRPPARARDPAPGAGAGAGLGRGVPGRGGGGLKGERNMAYWLFKSEPEAWSWDQQVAKKGPEPWNGGRNHQAANNMKAMRVGDLGFFYHSGAERSVVGIVEVIGGYRPDPTDENGRFGMVLVKAVRDLPKPVTLAEIKAEDGSAYRAFVTHTVNPYGYPAKDRSGRLDMLEPPDLNALIAKCAGAAVPVSAVAHSVIPASHESQE